MNTKDEFRRISRAFQRVREDMQFLKENVAYLRQAERDKDNKIALLEKELQILRYNNSKDKTTGIVKEAVEDTFFIGNIDSQKVHVSNCPYAKKIAKDNRVIFNTVKSALEENYVRCSCMTK